MNEELKKALAQELKDFKDNLPQYATPDDLDKKFDSLQEKIDAIGSDEMKSAIDELRNSAEKISEEVAKLNTSETTEKSFDEVIHDQAEQLQKIAKGELKNHSFEYTPKTDVTRASVTNHTLAMRLTDIGQLATLAPTIEPTFRAGTVGPNSNGVIRYVDQAAITRAAAPTAEGVQKPESAITWEEFTLPVQKIADTIPVTMEAFADVDYIAGELDRLLNINLALEIDQQLYSGTGVAPQLVGVNTTAAAWTAPTNVIPAATIYDLLVKMAESIVSAKKGKYQQTGMVAYMNIADINLMKLSKDANNNYIMPPFVTEAGRVVDGITIVESAQVAANTLTMGASRLYGTVYTLGGVRFDTGYVANQFVENKMTLLAEVRKALLIRNVDADGFAKSTSITTDLATMTPP